MTDPDELRALADRVSRVGWQRGQLTGMTCHDSRDAAAALRACAERLEADGWQDIASAPRDGTPVLGWWAHDGGPWPPKPGEGAAMAVTHFQEDCWWSECDDVVPPSHWRPLPDPPKDGT